MGAKCRRNRSVCDNRQNRHFFSVRVRWARLDIAARMLPESYVFQAGLPKHDTGQEAVLQTPHVDNSFMTSAPLKRGGFGLAATAAIIVTIWLGQWMGMFQSVDDWVGDRIQQWTLGSRGSYRVLLVYASPEILTSPEQLENLIERIDRSQPGVIGVLAESSDIRLRDGQDRAWQNRLVLGRPYGLFGARRAAAEAEFALPVPESDLRTGFIDLDLAGQPVYRRHWATARVRGQRVEAFEREIAKRTSVSADTMPEGPFRIRYAGAVNGLPHVNADQVLAGEVIPELIRDRVVLIGSPTRSEYGFATPTCQGRERMGRLELHGNIVECLLSRRWIRDAGMLGTLFWIALVTTVSIQVFRQCTPRWLARLVWGLLGISLLVATTAFCWGNVQIPVTAMLVSVFASAGHQAIRRFSVLRRAAELWRLMTESDSTMDDDSDPERVWDLITDAVYQMFYPKRMALMELKPHATHLHVVRTIHCTPESISEQRRDIQRQPYRDALDCSKPLRIASRCFFSTQVDRRETEFMVPLVFAAQPLGFMVLGMDTEALEDWQDFEGFLDQFAQEMSVLVANDRAARKEHDARARWIGRLRETPEEQTLTVVQHHHVEQQGEFNRLSIAFEIAESALAMCDVFGQVLRCNSQLLNLLQDVEITPTDTSCVEMVAALTGRSQHDCRRMFRMAIIHRRAEQIFIPAGRLRDYPCILMLKPLTIRTADEGGEIESRRVMVEIVEGRIFERMHQWQSRLRDRTCRRALTTVQRLESNVAGAAPHRLESGSADHDAEMGRTLGELKALLEACRRMADVRWDEDPENVAPIDLSTMMRHVVTRFTGPSNRRALEWAWDEPDDQATVVANPLLLERILTELWETMLRHSSPGSPVRLAGYQADRKYVLEIESEGEANPVEGLRKSLQGRDAGRPDVDLADAWMADVDRSLWKQIHHWVETWGGSLTIRSRDDMGLAVELVLDSERPDRDRLESVQRSGARRGGSADEVNPDWESKPGGLTA